MFFKPMRLRMISLFTLLMFAFSTFGAYAQTAAQTTPNLASILANTPEVQGLNMNLNNIQNSLAQIEQIAAPLYNKIVPTNMDAMSIGERIKAIVGNVQTQGQTGLQSYQNQVKDWNISRGIPADPSFEQELGAGLRELGAQAGQMPLNGKGNAIVDKLKGIVNMIKEKLQAIIAVIRAKVTALAQRIGIMKKKDTTDEKKKGDEDMVAAEPEAGVQNADTFGAKLSKGVSDGVQNAKTSLKNSFSFTNLAMTTTVTVGTNLALQMIKGEKPSFSKAAKAVASLEFAGSVVGSAIGAAGGQFTATLVKTFLPGPVGCLVGSVIPVMFGSLVGQMGSNVASGFKKGGVAGVSIAQAWKAVDKVDLIGSSIGSTIGMMLGAPIPIIGPIIGGILGGVVGAKIAKFVTSFIGGKKNLSTIFQGSTNINPYAPTTTGSSASYGGQSLGMNGGGQLGNGMTPTNDVGQIVPTSGDVNQLEQKYYEKYIQYNQLVEKGQTQDAQKAMTELKAYTEAINAAKAR